MSGYFDLMQEKERDRVFRSGVIVETVFPVADENRKREDRYQTTSDLTLGLVQRIFHPSAEGVAHLVVFAGIDHGNGCSQIAASVAQNLAVNAPGRVCLIEANFRSPSLAAILKTSNVCGLTNALLAQGPIWSFLKPVWNEKLWFLSSGPVGADSPNLLNSIAMKDRCLELRKEFEFVIIDAPPLSRHADAIALGRLCDGVVLVLEAESTRRESALAIVANLRSAEVPILGAVLNKRTFPIPEQIYRRL